VKGPRFDTRITNVRLGVFIGIDSKTESLRREKFDIVRSKLREDLAKLLQLVGVVGRNQNGVSPLES
jgi:hypothetical protein